MSRYTLVVLVICAAAVVESKPQFSDISRDVDVTPDSPVSVTPGKESNGDLGFGTSGSAERPASGSIHTGRPRPTINDIINALQNLTVHLPKQPTENNPDPESTESVPTTTTSGGCSGSNQPKAPTYPSGPQQPQQPVYPPQPPRVPVYPSGPQQPQQPVYPSQQPQQPDYSPQQPQQPTYPSGPQQPQQPVYPTDEENKSNHSIIIFKLNDSGVQYGGMDLTQLLSILQGKPGFVYVLQSGGQGKFIPLNQLHLLPQNSVPSYVVLLTYGQPNPILNPGLQLINGMLSTGNLGFHFSNFGLGSLPVYVANGYYPIWSILTNLGIDHPDHNGNAISTPYPGLVALDWLTTPTPAAAPTNPPVTIPVVQPPQISPKPDIDLVTLLDILKQRPNVDVDKNKDNDKRPDVSDSELIKLLLQVLNEKPGSETEHIIVKEKKNPTNLLHIIIELLGKKLGTDHVVVTSKKENNPSKLLQILIQLLRSKNQSGSIVLSHNNDNSESKLIQLLIKLISNQQDSSHVLISHNQDINQSNLLKILIQLLSKQPEYNKILVSHKNDDPSKLIQILMQILQKLPNISKDLSSSVIHFNDAIGTPSFDTEKLLQIVKILLKQQQSSNPTIFLQNQRPMVTGNSGVNSKILTMLFESGGSKNVKTALWSYLLGQLGCVHYQGRTAFCAK